MASRGYANGSALHISVSTVDDGHDVAAFHVDPRLEHRRTGRVQRLHIYDRLDNRVPHDKHNGAQVQARIKSSVVLVEVDALEIVVATCEIESQARHR